MGREIRMVPPNWDHPQTERHYGRVGPQPMYDQHYSDAVKDWKESFADWERGVRPDYFDAADYPDGIEFWEWENGPPERAFYRPWRDEEATWFQVWETVSEGTPVSPPFATREELIDYLAAHGDFWNQKRGDPAWGRKTAESFVGSGWAPSLVVMNGAVMSGVEGLSALGPAESGAGVGGEADEGNLPPDHQNPSSKQGDKAR